jgi:pimeloyl-ACP methyl ester carboxylesterase
MVETTRAFIHGLDSSSRGTKGSFFRARYPDMCMGDFNGPLEQRMTQMNDLLRGKKNLILVGSSFGGLMAALFTCNNRTFVERLVLLAPALGHADFRPFYETPLTLPVILYHGRHDVVVDPQSTLAIAQQLFSSLESHLVDDDHDLHRVFPTLDWNTLLR